jgi:hypothetical protein
MAGKKAWVWRPLLWWLLLVAALFGIHKYQQLLDATRIYFSVSLRGQPLPYLVSTTLDGKSISSGDKIPLGDHQFAIAGPKTTSFTTNLSIGFGKHDLGDIGLQRSMGILSVKTNPTALSIEVDGSGFSTNLQDSSGADFTVPTGSYDVRAQYRRWLDDRSASVTEGSTSTVTFSPQFATLNLSCNKDGATYQLQSDSGQIRDSGNLPAVVSDFPAGNRADN